MIAVRPLRLDAPCNDRRAGSRGLWSVLRRTRAAARTVWCERRRLARHAPPTVDGPPAGGRGSAHSGNGPDTGNKRQFGLSLALMRRVRVVIWGAVGVILAFPGITGMQRPATAVKSRRFRPECVPWTVQSVCADW